MIEVTLLIMKPIMLLWLVTLFAYGFVFGFVAFVGLLACVGLLIWLYWRVVVCRPRYAACGAFVGEFFGESYYSMEGAL